MTCNVGKIERALRILIGLALISLVFVGPQTPWGWIGLVLVATGGISWCPIWAVFGVSTCGARDGYKG